MTKTYKTELYYDVYAELRATQGQLEELKKKYDRAVEHSTDCESRMWDALTQRDALTSKLEMLKTDPTAVRVNILRGHLAKPWPEPHEVESELAAKLDDLQVRNTAGSEQVKAMAKEMRQVEAERDAKEQYALRMDALAEERLSVLREVEAERDELVRLARVQVDDQIARAEAAEAERDHLQMLIDSSSGQEIADAQARAEKAENESGVLLATLRLWSEFPHTGSYHCRACADHGDKAVAATVTALTPGAFSAYGPQEPTSEQLHEQRHQAELRQVHAQVAALRSAAEWALMHIRVVVQTGRVSEGGKQNGNLQCFELARDKLVVALADPNPGADFVSPHEAGISMVQHQAELRRVAEETWTAARSYGADSDAARKRKSAEIDAIVKGTK